MESFGAEFRFQSMPIFKYFSLTILSTVNELNIMYRSVVFISCSADSPSFLGFFFFFPPLLVFEIKVLCPSVIYNLIHDFCADVNKCHPNIFAFLINLS